jgi:ketosteroid isomerase-like protein
MKNMLAAILAAVLLAAGTAPARAASDDAQIRALEARFAAAFSKKDVDAIMKVYVPGKSLVVFDVVPPRQYVGAAAYRKDWEGFLGLFNGPIKFTIEDLAITVGGGVAFSHSIQHVVGTTKDGKPFDLTVRVTDGYKKVGGHWLVAHEHVSVPVDLETKTPDLSSKP